MKREDLREERGDLLTGSVPTERTEGGPRALRMEDQLLLRQSVISPGKPDGAVGDILQDGVFNGNIETKTLGGCAPLFRAVWTTSRSTGADDGKGRGSAD